MLTIANPAAANHVAKMTQSSMVDKLALCLGDQTSRVVNIPEPAALSMITRTYNRNIMMINDSAVNTNAMAVIWGPVDGVPGGVL